MKQKTVTKETSLKDSVLSRIDQEQLRPRSRFLCKCTEYSVWTLWFLTILLGAVALAELLYASMHAGVEFYDLTHSTLLQFVLANVPYLWIGTFITLLVVAYFNVRFTKCGYRHPVWFVVVSNIVLSIVLGLLLNAFGIGQQIDRLLGAMPMPYESVEERQAYLWAHPEDGRITGEYAGFTDDAQNVQFIDRVNRQWVVITTELSQGDFDLLVSGEPVRLIGEARLETSPVTFFACAVHPWMHKQDMPVRSIQANRQKLTETITTFMTRDEAGEDVMVCTSILSKLMP